VAGYVVKNAMRLASVLVSQPLNPHLVVGHPAGPPLSSKPLALLPLTLEPEAGSDFLETSNFSEQCMMAQAVHPSPPL